MDEPPEEQGEKAESPGLSDVLRREIMLSKLSHYELGKRAKVAPQGIMRFVKGERSLSLEVADRLFRVLGLVVTSATSRPPDVTSTASHPPDVTSAASRPARRSKLKARWERMKRRLEDAEKQIEFQKYCRHSAYKRQFEAEKRLEEIERQRTSAGEWWGANEDRYRLDRLLVDADNLGNRAILRLGLRYKAGSMHLRHREGLHRFLATLCRDNPLQREVLALGGLATFLESLLESGEMPSFFEALGAKVTPADVEYALQGTETHGAD